MDDVSATYAAARDGDAAPFKTDGYSTSKRLSTQQVTHELRYAWPWHRRGRCCANTHYASGFIL